MKTTLIQLDTRHDTETLTQIEEGSDRWWRGYLAGERGRIEDSAARFNRWQRRELLLEALAILVAAGAIGLIGLCLMLW